MRRNHFQSIHGMGVEALQRLSARLCKRISELYRLTARTEKLYIRQAQWNALAFAQMRVDEINERMEKIRGNKEENMEKFPIERFLKAQETVYERALQELKNGKKVSHWMWYIFPQLRFLGRSDTALYYGIADEDEAKEYCQNSLLHGRYIECCQALQTVKERDVSKVLGAVDALKLCSSLTLFRMVDEGNRPLYQTLVDKFYGGKWDSATVEYLQNRRDARLDVR